MQRKTRAAALAAVAVALASLGALGATAAVRGDDGGPAAVKRATARYRSAAVAEHAGYGLLKDTAGIACIANPGVGAMGDHDANSALVGDGKIDDRSPEAVLYEPGRGGSLRLAAVEYVVLQSAWDATHHMAPMLFGHIFMLTPAPNRFGLPAFYSLHAWLWKHNPSGTYAMWNPRVSCAFG
jgi:hypothetical protein